MLNKLRQFLKTRNLLSPGDSVTCALSGGADSIALLFALFLVLSYGVFLKKDIQFRS